MMMCRGNQKREKEGTIKFENKTRRRTLRELNPKETSVFPKLNTKSEDKTTSIDNNILYRFPENKTTISFVRLDFLSQNKIISWLNVIIHLSRHRSRRNPSETGFSSNFRQFLANFYYYLIAIIIN